MALHPTALISPKAELAEDVTVGAYSVIGDHVRIGAGTWIGNRVSLVGNMEVGRRCRIWDGAVLGAPPQDYDFHDDPTRLVIGDENVVREHVTINVGTLKGGGVTLIGNRNFFMACSHVAHDCCIEDDVVLTNGVLLAGHVKVESHVILSGNAGVHHYARIGRLAFVGGNTGVTQDVPPFMMVDGHRAYPRRVNIIGLKRAGMDPDGVDAIQEAFRLLYRSRRSRRDVIQEMIERDDLTPEVQYLVEFLRQSQMDKRGRYLETMRAEGG